MTRLKKNRKYEYAVAGIMILMLISWLISANLYQIMLIQGSSMEPSLHSWQFVILKKDFVAEELKKGDIIAFQCRDLNAVLVKRIKAVPGEIVIEAGMERPLEAGEYYVLGDNLDESVDSRDSRVGIVQFADIIGIVCE